jgi:hypothetical protein
MKNLQILFALAFALATMPAFAQLSIDDLANIRVVEEQKVMSAGNNNSLSVTIPGADEKGISKTWEKRLKKYKGKVKKVKKVDEQLGDNMEITEVGGANTVDVYSKVTGNTLTVWFDLGGAYLSSYQHPSQYAGAERLLLATTKDVFVSLVEGEMSTEEDKLKKQEKNYEKLVKDKKGLEKDIEEYKAKIAKAEAEIVKNTQEQEATQSAIGAQKNVVEEVKARLSKLQ